MPVIGTVDVAVHLHRVHNIDLFCRGVYYLRASLLLPARKGPGGDAATKGDRDGSSGKGNNNGNSSAGAGGEGAAEQQVEAQGIPYMCLAQCEDTETTVAHRKVPPLKERRLQGPAVHGHHYHSRMFVIRYRDEELELGEVVNFQIPVELDAGRRWLEAGRPLVLQMELMFSKLASLETDSVAIKKATNGAGSAAGGSAAASWGEGGIGSGEEEGLNMEPVSVQRFEASLSGGHWGLHAYVPVTFSGVHFVRVDCMVHGVLRNLKLEPPPTASDNSQLGAAAPPAALVVKSTTEQRDALLQDEAAAKRQEESASSRPASLARLGSRDGASGSEGEAAGPSSAIASARAKKRNAPAKKYTWFSLYEDQGVGGRRNSIRSWETGGGGHGLSGAPGGLVGVSDMGVGGARVDDGGGGGGGGGRRSNRSGSGSSSGSGSGNQQSSRTQGQESSTSSKSEPSWRWGWGRRRSGSVETEQAAAAVAASTLSNGTGSEGGKGVDRGHAPDVGLGSEGAGPCKAPRKRIAEIERERRRLRRKDVYSYFIMPLVRALEAQMGTTAWLRKLLDSENLKEIPRSAAPLWMPPDPGCGRDVTRVLCRLFASDDDVAGRAGPSSGPGTGPGPPATGTPGTGPPETGPPGAGPLGTGPPGTPSPRETGGGGGGGQIGGKDQIFSTTMKGGDMNGDRGGVEGVEGFSSEQQGWRVPQTAKVAFPALISRYCSGPGPEGGGGEGEGGGGDGPAWLDTEDRTCAALELDVHALAILVFVEWREFVSALPGCGSVLSRETSALWFAQIRQRWACQATLHTCSALQKPPDGLTASKPAPLPPSEAFDTAGRPSKLPASAMGAPLVSRLEPEIGSESFGVAVRMACADASAPYKLPLLDQHMFPDGEAMLPVCLVQRYERPEEEKPAVEAGVGVGAGFGLRVGVGDGAGIGGGQRSAEGGMVVAGGRSPPSSPGWVPALQAPVLGRASTLPAAFPPAPTPILPFRKGGSSSRGSSSPRTTSTAPVSPAARAAVGPARAFSSSPRARHGRVATVTSATAAAAVAAAVAAAIPFAAGDDDDDSDDSSDNDDRDESSSSSPPAEPLVAKRKPRMMRRSRHSRSRSPVRTGATTERGEAASVAGPGKAGGRTGRSTAAAFAFAGGEKRRKEFRADASSPAAGVNPSVVNGHGHHPHKGVAGGGGGGAERLPAAAAAAGAPEGQPAAGRVNVSPTTPQRPPRTNSDSSPRPQRRGAGARAGAESVVGALVPPSPMRRSPLASPARPPLKPMDAEQERGGVGGGGGGGGACGGRDGSAAPPTPPADRTGAMRGMARGMITRGVSTRGPFRGSIRGETRGEIRGGADGGGGGGAAASPTAGLTKRDSGSAGSSLLDGVEQSSDLGAFFRRGEGLGVRRGKGRGSPRLAGLGGTGGSSCTLESREGEDGEYDDEEEEEEERENRSGAGVGVHVVVLHHGYCGSSMDMRLIKNYIRILAPDVLVLNAESNERDQHTSMKVMGERLAKDVHRFLLVRARNLLLPGGQGRLSFIGHSAGAVIIRAALTSRSLKPALSRLHLFVSLGSPHLGTVYGSSGIVRTGMWAMKRWTKSELLEELGLTDASHPRDTLLCWLSQQPGLEYFRHVVLVSADKDGYVPPQSARVQMCDSSVRDAKREVQHGQVVCEMAKSLLGPVSEKSLYRLHLWGGGKLASGSGGGVDEYIGRTAHISMMDSPSLVCLLLCTLLDLIR